MRSFFARHEVDLQAPKNKDPKAPVPRSGLDCLVVMGGNPGQKFAERIVKRMNTIDEQKTECQLNQKFGPASLVCRKSRDNIVYGGGLQMG